MIRASLPRTVGLVLHFRDCQRTSRCLASLARDGVDRALVVDNSDDGGASLSALRARAWPGLSVEWVEPGGNLGFSAGVNRGLDHINALFGESCVLLINSDAELREGSHGALRRVIGQGLQLAAAAMVSPLGPRLGWVYYQPHLGLLSRRRVPGSFPYLSACCVLLSPSLATARPFLDERFFFYGEDIELGWRLARSGVAHGVAPGASVDHEGSAASGNGSLFYEYHMARAHLLLVSALARNRIERLSMMLGRLVVLPLRSTVRSVRSASIAPWKGLLLAILHTALGKTGSIQPGRR